MSALTTSINNVIQYCEELEVSVFSLILVLEKKKLTRREKRQLWLIKKRLKIQNEPTKQVSTGLARVS